MNLVLLTVELYIDGFFVIFHFMSTNDLIVCTFTLAPNSVTMSENSEQTTDSAVAVIYTEETFVDFDVYKFSVQPADADDMEKLKDDTDRSVVFSGLVPGTVYTVTVETYKGDVASEPKTINIATGNFSNI